MRIYADGYQGMAIDVCVSMASPGIAGMWHKGACTTILASPSPACLDTCCTNRREKESSCDNEQENGLVVPVRATRTARARMATRTVRATRTVAHARGPAYPHSHTRQCHDIDTRHVKRYLSRLIHTRHIDRARDLYR